MTDPLPEVFEGVLDEAALAAYWQDLREAIVVEVRAQGGPALSSPVRDLDGAREALAAGATAVQLRYRYAGSSWIDTVQPRPPGARLVRIRAVGG